MRLNVDTMKKLGILLLCVIMLVPVVASAQCPVSVAIGDNSRIRTSFGVGVCGAYTMLTPSLSNLDLKPEIGLGGHVQMALLFNRFFGIETEVGYVRGSVKASFDGSRPKHEIETTNVDIPLFLTFRLFGIAHLNLGPQFTVMSRAEYAIDGQTYFFGPMYPTFNVAASLRLKLLGNLMLEGRYIYPLRVSNNSFMGSEFTTVAKRATLGLTLSF